MHFQAYLKARNLTGLIVGQQPVVCVSAIVVVEHNPHILVDRAGILHRPARPHKLRHAVGIEQRVAGDGGLGDHESGGVDAEIIVADDHPGETVGQHVIAVGGNNVEDDGPAATGGDVGPVAVGNDRLVVPGHRSSRNQRTAVARRLEDGRVRPLFLFVKPGNVVVRKFFHRVQSHHVPQIQVDAVGVQAIHDALQFLLILRVNMLPQNVLCGGAIEIPIALGVVRGHRANGVNTTCNLGRQQVTVLISDVGGRAFEVNVHPMIALEAIGRFQARFVRLSWILLCERESSRAEQDTGCEQ